MGNIRSISLEGCGSGKGKFRKGAILRPDTGKTGKKRVSLYIDGIRKRYTVSNLVAKTYPEICGFWFEGCQVHHKDRNPRNNAPENLIVITKEEHSALHYREDNKNIGSKNPFFGRRHSVAAKREMRKKHRKPIVQIKDNQPFMYWFSATDCERATGLKKSSINKCCLGYQKTAYGCKWEYAKKGEI